MPTCTVTETRGLYAFSGLPAGDYRVSASANGYLPGVALGGDPIVISGTKFSRSGVDIRLGDGALKIAGTVLDMLGGPIAGARVRAFVAPDSAVRWRVPVQAFSDGAGEFELWVPRDRLKIVATADGYAPGSLSRTPPASELKLLLSPAGSISGTVLTREDGKPVAHAKVHAIGAALSEQFAATDERGTFTVSALSAGIYRLEVRSPGWRGQYPESVLLNVAGSVSGIAIAVERAATLEGRIVVASSKKACTEGSVFLTPLAGANLPRSDAFTDGLGHVRLEAVPAGRYQVQVNCEGYTSPEPSQFEVARHDTSNLEWTVTTGLALDVLAVDARDLPVAKSQLVLREVVEHEPPTGIGSRRELQLGGVTDGTGYARFSGLPPGKFSINGALVRAPVTVQLAEHSQSNRAKVVLDAAGKIEVSVRAERSRSIDGVKVFAVLQKDGSEGLPLGLTTDSVDGIYQLDPVPIGIYRVYARDGLNARTVASDQSGKRDVVVRPNEIARAQIVLPAGDGKIVGRVIDERRAPIPNVWVSVASNDANLDPSQGMFEIQAVLEGRRSLADPQGNFEIDGLRSSGLFDLRVDRPLGGTVVRPGVRTGDRVEVVLDSCGRLSGSAVDWQGRTVQQFAIEMINADARQQRTQQIQRADGTWSLGDVAPGHVSLSSTDAAGNTASANVDLNPGQALDAIRLVFRPDARL